MCIIFDLSFMCHCSTSLSRSFEARLGSDYRQLQPYLPRRGPNFEVEFFVNGVLGHLHGQICSLYGRSVKGMDSLSLACHCWPKIWRVDLQFLGRYEAVLFGGSPEGLQVGALREALGGTPMYRPGRPWLKKLCFSWVHLQENGLQTAG